MQEDQDLIDLFLRRREEAIAQTQQRYGGYCAAIARSILPEPDDVQECLSTVWLRLWQTIPPTVPLRFRPYLAQLTRNAALDLWRSARAEKRGSGELPLVLEELEECIPGPEDPEKACLARELGDILNDFVHGLNQPARSVFVRRYYCAEPVEEIAARYGLTPGHVRVLLHRARGRLKERLIKEGYDREG